MTSRAKLVMFMILVILAGGAVYLHTLARRVSTEPPVADENARTRLAEAALLSSSGPTSKVTLYFPSEEEGSLIQETRQIAWADNDLDRIRQVLLALIEGSHQGHGRPLPSSTDVRAVFLTSDGTAYVDLSNNALGLFSPGIGSETLAVYSIVDSLGINIPAVKRVRILVQGQEVETLNGHVDLTGEFIPDPNLTASVP